MNKEEIEAKIQEWLDKQAKAEDEKTLKVCGLMIANYQDLWKLKDEEERIIAERQDRNRRYDLDEMKYEAERREAEAKIKQLRHDTRMRVLDRVLQMLMIIGTIGLIYGIQEKGFLIDSKPWAVFMKLLHF